MSDQYYLSSLKLSLRRCLTNHTSQYKDANTREEAGKKGVEREWTYDHTVLHAMHRWMNVDQIISDDLQREDKLEYLNTRIG